MKQLVYIMNEKNHGFRVLLSGQDEAVANGVDFLLAQHALVVVADCCDYPVEVALFLDYGKFYKVV